MLSCWCAIHRAPVECAAAAGDPAAAGPTADGGPIDVALVGWADARATAAEVAATQDLPERHEKRGWECLRPAGVDAELLEGIIGRPVREPPVLRPACA